MLDGGGGEARLRRRDAKFARPNVLGQRVGEVVVEVLANCKIDDGPHQARPLLAHAQGAVSLPLAGHGMELDEKGRSDGAGEEVA